MQEESKGTILVVDDIPNNITLLFEYLSKHGYRIMIAQDGLSALEQVKYAKPDLIILDIMMPGIDGYETCKRFKSDEKTKDIPVIFMSSLYDTKDKVLGFSVGAVDYITKPIQYDEVLARVDTHVTLRKLQLELNKINSILENKIEERTLQLKEANIKLQDEIQIRLKAEETLKETLKTIKLLKNKVQLENIYLQEEIKLEHNFDEIITQSSAMNILLSQIERIAKTDSIVLITGETGTGKELLARAIHNTSNRSNRTLVKVNCAALPANLIESELFGHERGAFTGAFAKKLGRFELADGGTIFLDEIGELPLELQVKLLRVLQEGEFERVGGSATLKVDVRIIAATNIDLAEAIKNGKFREDLFYRLNVFPIHTPPLRERIGDIPLLVNFFVNKFSKKYNKKIEIIPNHIFDTLNDYRFPGNVRELENLIERAVILSPGNNLFIDMPVTKTINTNLIKVPDRLPEIKKLKEIEKEHILLALEKCHWVIDGNKGAAKLLGLPQSTLRDRMKKHDITRPKE